MSETIVIEAVSNKFANKYNSGSVLAGGKWMQVSSKLDLADFKKDSQVTVETKTNDKGYTSIVGIVKEDVVQAVESVIAESRPEAATKTSKRVAKEPSYDEAKSRRILVQGIVQACTASPSLAGLPYTNTTELAANIKALALEMIAFVDQESN